MQLLFKRKSHALKLLFIRLPRSFLSSLQLYKVKGMPSIYITRKIQILIKLMIMICALKGK